MLLYYVIENTHSNTHQRAMDPAIPIRDTFSRAKIHTMRSLYFISDTSVKVEVVVQPSTTLLTSTPPAAPSPIEHNQTFPLRLFFLW